MFNTKPEISCQLIVCSNRNFFLLKITRNDTRRTGGRGPLSWKQPGLSGEHSTKSANGKAILYWLKITVQRIIEHRFAGTAEKSVAREITAVTNKLIFTSWFSHLLEIK